MNGAPFFVIVMNLSPVPPEALNVTLMHVPTSRTWSVLGEMAHVGIGEPVNVVVLSQVQVVPAVLPVDESVMCAE